jgi:4a-hydroxytetrahydrobiopterin dehydratase
MPTLLDDRLVSDALTALTDWTGDAQRIRRTVDLPGDAVEGLLADVAVSADSLNHHPEIERSGGSVTFTLWTHSEGGVTEYDIALASRIDDLVAKARGTGTVVGAATEEGTGAGAVGLGERRGGGTREDVHVPSTPAETVERGVNLAGDNTEQLEPLVGARAANRDTPGVPLPDTVPDEPQPGIGRPEGQGTPPAGQNVGMPSDEGGPGDRS